MAGDRVIVLRHALLVLILVTIAPSCGEGEISQDQILTDIPSAILPDHPELIAAIECRPEIGLDPSVTSQCNATLADEPISFTIAATDDGSDSVTVELDQTVIETAPLIRNARRALRSDLGTKLEVECVTTAVVVAKKGARIACTALDETEHSFSIRLIDETGRYKIDLS